MNIGLIGSGGREHSLCRKIYESKSVKKIICFPGNAGTAKFAKNVAIRVKASNSLFIIFFLFKTIIYLTLLFFLSTIQA